MCTGSCAVLTKGRGGKGNLSMLPACLFVKGGWASFLCHQQQQGQLGNEL